MTESLRGSLRSVHHRGIWKQPGRFARGAHTSRPGTEASTVPVLLGNVNHQCAVGQGGVGMVLVSMDRSCQTTRADRGTAFGSQPVGGPVGVATALLLPLVAGEYCSVVGKQKAWLCALAARRGVPSPHAHSVPLYSDRCKSEIHRRCAVACHQRMTDIRSSMVHSGTQQHRTSACCCGLENSMGLSTPLGPRM